MSGESKEGGSPGLRTFMRVAALVFLAWLFSWFLLNYLVNSATQGDLAVEQLRGVFGDKFGAINSLFSGLAFAGIIFTIILQKKELGLQREELERARRLSEEQMKAVSRQRFESTFFNLLDLHGRIVSNLEVMASRGAAAHVALYERLVHSDADFSAFRALRKLDREHVLAIQANGQVSRELYPALTESDVSTLQECLLARKEAFNRYLDDNLDMHKSKLVSAYERLCVEHLDSVAHYFRNLYHVLRFVDDADFLSDEEKKGYVRILRSQLSDAELVSLFYNSVLPYRVPGRAVELGHPKMKRLLQKHSVLHNMDVRALLHPIHEAIFNRGV